MQNTYFAHISPEVFNQNFMQIFFALETEQSFSEAELIDTTKLHIKHVTQKSNRSLCE